MKRRPPCAPALARPWPLLLASASAGAAEADWYAPTVPYWLWGGLLGGVLVALSLLLFPAMRRLLEPAHERLRRRLMLKSAALGWFEYHPGSGRLRCDPEALAALLGLSADWQDGPLARWSERLPPEELDQLQRQARDLAFVPGDEYQFKLRVLHADGHWEWLALLLAVPEKKGAAAPLCGVARLITQSHLLESTQRRCELSFELLLENSPDIVSRYDLQLNCLSVNRAINRYLRQPRDELIGRSVAMRGWDEALTARFENECRQSLKTLQPRRFELEFVLANRPHVFDVRLFPEQDEEGKPLSILCLEHEITESRQTQLLLEEENIVLEMVADNRPLAEVLNQLCRMIETQLLQGSCSVMLVDKQGERLIVAAGPSVPGGFLKTIDGILIGPNQATSGSSAYWRRTIMVNDVEDSPLWIEYKDLACAFGILAAWSVPIMTNEQHLLGTLTIHYPEKRSPTPDEMQLAYRSSHIAAIAIERDRHEKRLYHEATRDVLTNGFNRRHFLELGMRELKRARRYDMPLALLMLDLDHFKAINDAYGHQTGDTVLRQFSRLAHGSLRGSDVLGRLGGEEFAALLPATGLSEAMLVAERIRSSVEQHSIEWLSQPMQCSVSIGVTVALPQDSSIDEMLTRADQALHLAKGHGRNRVACLPELPLPKQKTG